MTRVTPLVSGVMLVFGLGSSHERVAAQVFTAVTIHGAGVPEPFLIEGEEQARCLWFFTYNFIGNRHAKAVGQIDHEVTLSFLTESERQAVEGSPAPQKKAQFHTRLQLTRDKPPYVQFRKPRDESFVFRMELHPAAEAYLGTRGIPTRLDSSGAPTVRVLSPDERDAASTELLSTVGGCPSQLYSGRG